MDHISREERVKTQRMSVSYYELNQVVETNDNFVLYIETNICSFLMDYAWNNFLVDQSCQSNREI